MRAATIHTLPCNQSIHRPRVFSPAGIVASIWHTIQIWRARSQERRELASLDYRELRDIGLSQWEVDRELAKPFWRD